VARLRSPVRGNYGQLPLTHRRLCSRKRLSSVSTNSIASATLAPSARPVVEPRAPRQTSVGIGHPARRVRGFLAFGMVGLSGEIRVVRLRG
jgi:hypothetical protein